MRSAGISIHDFRSGRDVLDVRGAIETVAGADHFDGQDVTFAGGHTFSGHGLEIGFKHHYRGGAGQAGSTTVELSIGGTVRDLVDLHGMVEPARDDLPF